MTRLWPSSSDAVLLTATAAAAMGLALSPTAQPPERFVAAQHATAVLAWAQTRCPWAGALKADAPKVHAEDLMAVAAAFEFKTRHQPLSDVCAQAIALTAPVSTQTVSAPPHRDERDVVAAR